jgi:hypothetical protein
VVCSSQREIDHSGFNLEISLNNSGVGFGGNRVSTMTLKRLRFIAASGETWEQEVNSIVHQTN